MDKSSKIMGIISGLVFIFLIIYATAVDKSEKKEDTFEGVITNMELSPGKITGKGVYDKSCNSLENGLTNCDAGIETEKGLLNFNYIHDMGKQGCIGPGDTLEVEITDSNKARVRRTK